jgi:hypothetical protein
VRNWCGKSRAELTWVFLPGVRSLRADLEPHNLKVTLRWDR